ncbi:MAG: 23S rRNA (adenine(2503)-C(2))-methyltransferase RlmN [Gammaproteobacteria bacterium]|nr:23S rRNA (adenine(2503)-C(2))-methyltransferase RlmN [Gammaproteobacteria bacterium]
MSDTAKTNLMGLDRAAMEAYFASLGEKSFRASQVMKWVHQEGVSDFAEMTNLSKALRTQLTDCAELTVPEIFSDRLSQDGTRKWLLRVPGKSAIEMVFIPERTRGTLCVSSQVGCTLDCAFCATGKQGYNRDLTAAEIIGQVWLAKHMLAEQYQTDRRLVSNVVMMGMGEPLMNFDNVVTAMNIMQDDFCFGLSKRRITLSTAGVVPKIDQLKAACPVSLAVSLHAPNDELRNQLVPLNRKYPIKQLMAACNRYVADSQRARITFEYVMLEGINDELQHARELVELMKTVPGKVNLIPFNPFPGIDFKRSSNSRINRFRDVLHEAGTIVTVRRTRGDDIEAACGQLAGDVMDRTRRSEKFRQKQGEKIQ